jgi:hypothetical protein
MDSQGRSKAEPLVGGATIIPAPKGAEERSSPPCTSSMRPPRPGRGSWGSSLTRGSAALHPWLHSVAPTGAGAWHVDVVFQEPDTDFPTATEHYLLIATRFCRLVVQSDSAEPATTGVRT